MTLVDNEKFYSSIINLVVGDKKQAAIVKDLQMHPARNAIVHVDLQRVVETEKIRIHLPIHFKGEAASPGVKTQGGVVSHRIADVEVSCLPKDLPEFIELDLSQMNMNESKHLSDLPLPPGVTIPAIAKGNATVVSIHPPRAEEPEPTAEAAAAAPAEGTDFRRVCRACNSEEWYQRVVRINAGAATSVWSRKFDCHARESACEEIPLGTGTIQNRNVYKSESDREPCSISSQALARGRRQ